MKNGEYKLSAADVYIPGRSLSVGLTRTYGSRRQYNSRFGYGWDISYNLKVRRLNDDQNTIVFLNGECLRQEYTRDEIEPNIYKRSTNLSHYFVYDDVNDTFTLVHKNGMEYHFDIYDRLSSITNENGNSITFTYDANGLMPLYGPSEFFLGEEFGGPAGGYGLVAMSYKLVKITDDLGRQVSLSYNGEGLLKTVTDFAGRTWDYTYDSGTNNLLAVTGPATTDYPDGLTTAYVYDANHNLEYVYDANEQMVVRNYYDSGDKVYKQTIGDGSYEFAYNDANNTAIITDREGFKTKIVYNGVGQVLSRTIYTADANADPNSFTWQHVYNASEKRIRDIFPAGNCIDYTYDDLGNTTGIYRKTSPSDPNDPNNPNVIAAVYTYDPDFVYKVKTVRDPMGNVTTYDYNDLTGNLEKITYPTVKTPDGNEMPIESFTYNGYGQRETIITPDNMVIKYEYYNDANDANNYGRPWKVIADYGTDPNCLNIAVEYKYDVLGNVIEIKDPNGDIAKSEYNNLGQLIKTITYSPYDYVTKFSYDKKGNQSKIEREIGGDAEPNQVTSFAYNAHNKLISMTDPLNHVAKYSYNKNEEPNKVIDAENNTTLTEYNERGLVAKVTDANGGITRFSYDRNGNLKDINDPNGNVTRFEYDVFGQLVKVIYPYDSNEVFSYDKNGSVTSMTTRKGETIRYQYDAMNRMTVKSRPGDPNIVVTCDIAGRVVDVNDGRAVSEGGGITTYKYDRVGRVKEVNDIYGKTVKSEYNNKGLRKTITYPNGSVYYYEYDAMGRLTNVKLDPVYSAAAYSYDELSRRIQVSRYNGGTTSYEYDLGNRLKHLTNTFYGGSTTVFDYNNYDKVSNRLSMRVGDANANTQVYTYDKRYQLTFVDYNDGSKTWYYYDKLGNRNKVTQNTTDTVYLGNRLNEYLNVGAVNYTYDKNGNLTYDGLYKYYYDCENRLTDVNSAADARIASYKYDYRGKRVKKILYGSPDVVTTCCYDGGRIIADYNEAGILQRRYLYGAGIDEPVYMVSGSYSYYYYYDGLGSVTALARLGQPPVERYTYDVYGRPTIRDANGVILTTSSVGNRYMFTGREYESETGLYYYRARYYNPSIGRFISGDPIGYNGGLNLYCYVKNNPINLIDSLGLCPSSSDEAAASGSFCGGGYGDRALHPGADACYREVVPIGSGPSGEHCCYSGGKLINGHRDRVSPAVGRNSDGSCQYDLGRLLDHLWCDVL